MLRLDDECAIPTLRKCVVWLLTGHVFDWNDCAVPFMNQDTLYWLNLSASLSIPSTSTVYRVRASCLTTRPCAHIRCKTTSITRASLTLPIIPWLLTIPDVPYFQVCPHRYQVCDEALPMKGSGNLVLWTHGTRSAPVTWSLPLDRLLVGP